MFKRNAGAFLALVFAIVPAVVLSVPARGEEAVGGWQKEVKVGINVLQSSYTQNWNTSEKGSVVWTGNVDARFDRQFSETANWRNTLKLAYGQTHKQARDESGRLYWPKPDKSDDLIDFESLFRWTLAGGWDPFVSVQYKSLFEDVTDPSGRTQNFNPMKFKEAVGISRKLVDKEDRQLLSRIGVAFIQNRRSFFTDPAPVMDTETENSTEIGAEWITEYRVGALSGRVDWESILALTLPFTYSGKSVFEDGFNSVEPLPEDVAGYTTTIDIDWQNTFTANITKVISVKLYLRWVYDKYDNSVKPVVDENGDLANEPDVHAAIRKAGQFKQTLALGFGYSFD